MTEEAGPTTHAAISVAAGAAAIVAGGALGIYRGAKRLPLVGDALQRTEADLTARGDQAIAAVTEPVKALIQTVAVQVTEMVLDELDITSLVRDRVDLAGLASQVIDDIDLPGIIRTSTASVTADVMTDVRGQGERADDAVAGFVNRVLGRNGDLR